MEKICIHCFVSGRVQGVWFRASTKAEADSLNIVGWVRNLSDGRVEVLACGEKANITKFYQWLQQGPRLARVDEVSYDEIPEEDHQGFNII